LKGKKKSSSLDECCAILKYTWVLQLVDSMDGVYKFSEKLRAGEEPSRPITLFSFKDYFPAVATTDVLSRVMDE
jgi:hypothetical protein